VSTLANAIQAPEVSIGLPVYNGEKFVGDAIRAILEQTFSDFELIISDNASTDRTEQICRHFASKDARIRYFRNRTNLGASANFNAVFERASAPYFKWIAHDDLHEPEFLAECLRVLRSDSSAVLAFTRGITVDHAGNYIREWGAGPELGANRAVDRYRKSMAPAVDPLPLALFGVIRADPLRATRLFRWYPDADLALLAELSLRGRCHEIPSPLFVQREHRDRAGPRLAKEPHKAAAHWAPARAGRVQFPHWALLAGHLSVLLRSPIGWRERLACMVILCGWAQKRIGRFFGDIVLVASRVPAAGYLVAKLADAVRLWKWRARRRGAVKDIHALIPSSSTYVLVDAGQLVGVLKERGGNIDWTPPPNDETAVRELEEFRTRGASFLVFGWPCFWWLTYYKGLVAYIDARFRRIRSSRRVVIYDLCQESADPAQNS
jgi:glycosyltransferase involved in cell wall biosynthesis